MSVVVETRKDIDRSGCREEVCTCHDDTAWEKGASYLHGCPACGCHWTVEVGPDQPLLPTMEEVPLNPNPTPTWQERPVEELVREVLHLSEDDPIPDYLEVRSQGENDHGQGTYRIPTDPYDVRRVAFVPDDAGEGDIDWDNWKEAAYEWASNMAGAARDHVHDCWRDEEVYDFTPDSMPEPEDYREDDIEEREYCCQVVGKEDREDSVPHLDWAMAMYMLLTTDEAEFLRTANDLTD